MGNSTKQNIVQADTNVPEVLRVGITEGFEREVEKENTVQQSTELKSVPVSRDEFQRRREL